MENLPHRLSPEQLRLHIIDYMLRKGDRVDAPGFLGRLNATADVVLTGAKKHDVIAIRYGCLLMAFGRGYKIGFPELAKAVDDFHALIRGEDATVPAPATKAEADGAEAGAAAA